MPAGRRPRKLTRVQIALMRRTPRRREGFICDYAFPSHIRGRVRKRLPQVAERDRPLVEQGLREWFVCCAWRGGAVLGMPARAVDEAWHEFILDSIAYIDFCEKAFGACSGTSTSGWGSTSRSGSTGCSSPASAPPPPPIR